MYEVFDLNTGETIHSIRDLRQAQQTVRDMNEPWIGEGRMYGMRTVE